MPAPAAAAAGGFGHYLWSFCKASWSSQGLGASGLVWYAAAATGAQVVEKLQNDDKTTTSIACKNATDKEAAEIRQSRILRYGLWGFLTKYPAMWTFQVVRWGLGAHVGAVGAVCLYDMIVIPGVAMGALVFTNKLAGEDNALAHVGSKGKTVWLAGVLFFLPMDCLMYSGFPGSAAVVPWLASGEYFVIRPLFHMFVSHQCALPATAEYEAVGGGDTAPTSDPSAPPAAAADEE